MTISPFTPLFFSPSSDASGLQSDFVQTWLNTDRIYIQVICEQDEVVPEIKVDLKIKNLVAETEYLNMTEEMRNSEEGKALANKILTTIDWHPYEIVAGKYILFAYLQNMNEGYYTVQIGDMVSEIFRVTDDATEVEDTVLLQYCNKDNRQRTDAAFLIAEVLTFFSWRVPGGFKDDNWQFSVENEQFVSQEQDIFELYSRESTQKTLTVGLNTGVPVWYGEFLNRILTCTFFYVDRVRYCRKESSVPERQSVMDGLRAYVFNQQLQEVVHGNALTEYDNQLFLRYADTDKARTANMTKQATVDGKTYTIENPTVAVDYEIN